MNNKKVYKKQIDSNSFVYIGEAIKHKDKNNWDIDFISNSCSSEKESYKTDSLKVNKYDKYFYVLKEREYEKLDVSFNYYKCQLYSNKEFTITTGMQGYFSLPYYYDYF